MRRRWRAGMVSVVLMVVAAALAVPQASTAGRRGLVPAPAGTRAMWLWGDDPAAGVVDWAMAHGVSEIFVHVSPSVLTDARLARLQEMKQRADAARSGSPRSAVTVPGRPTTRLPSPGSGASCARASSPASTWTWSRT